MDLSYVLTPFVAWLTAGSLKFLINSLRTKQLTFGQIGYGGLPSNHSAIVCSTTALIALREGISHPSFGIAITLAFIVILDAHSLRREVGRHAIAINRMSAGIASPILLRERIGHTPVEIAAGALVGILVAISIFNIF